MEIIPENDPSALKPGEDLRVVVKSEGRPLAGALVTARDNRESAKPVSTRTDEQGRAVLRLADPGMWVVDTVDMFAAPADSGADWESVWASLSFEIAAQANAVKDQGGSKEKTK